MKNIILLAILVFGGYFLYKKFGPKSEAVLAYEAFAGHMARGHYPDAKPLATGAALADIEKALQPPPSFNAAPAGSMMGMVQQAMSPQAMEAYKRDMISQISGDITKIKYEQVEENKMGDGKVSVSALQKVYRYRAGDRVIGGDKIFRTKQEAVMVKEGAGWKVDSFKETEMK